MSNFWKRAITGTLFVVLMVSAILAGLEFIVVLFGVASLIGAAEFTKIIGRPFGSTFSGSWAVFSSLVIYLIIAGISLDCTGEESLAFAIPLIVIQVSIELFNPHHDFTKMAALVFGKVLIPAAFGLLSVVSVTLGYYEFMIPLGFFIFLWVNDTGAYIMGKNFGKNKLIPKVSPGKTVEGFVGGVGFTLAAAFIVSYLNPDVLERTDWIVFALIVAVFSNFGDFAESMLKRQYGVKDSGRALPGHGGILDRFDGILLAVPLLFFYLLLRY